MPEVGPTARRRKVAEELKRMRRAAGMTLEDAGKATGTSRATVAKYESRKGGVKWLVVEGLCRAYRVPVREREALVELAKHSSARGWWDNYTDTIPHRITPLLMLEDEARAESHWANTYVPGLLQTRRYATAVHRAVGPELPDEEIDRQVDTRMRRQEVLRRSSPLHLSVVMDESVVRRVVGDLSIMADQLRHLTKSAGPLLDLRVLPYSAGAHPADSGSAFTIIHGQAEDLDVVHTAHLTGTLYLEKPAERARHTHVFERLQEQALPLAASVDLLMAVSDEFDAAARA